MKHIITIVTILLALACAGCAKQAKSESTGEEEIYVTNIYNLVILDQSGSMTFLREAAFCGYNGTLDVIRSAQEQHGLEQQNFVSLTLFNWYITEVFDCDSIQNVPYLLWDDYFPNGGTAMLDGIGISLTSLQHNLDTLDNATAIVTIISDGLENASEKYSHEQVVDMIDKLKKQGVMFVFMGTDIDVARVASSLHIDEYKVFENTTEGMNEAWATSMKASHGYYNRMAEYNKNTRNMTKEQRNAYFRDKNKENGWFERTKK